MVPKLHFDQSRLLMNRSSRRLLDDRDLNRDARCLDGSVVRLVLGLIFFAQDAQKMLGWYGGPGLAESMHTFTKHLRLPSILAFCDCRRIFWVESP